MKKIMGLIIAVMLFSSCQKELEGMKKNFQTTNRHYHVEQYSGGVLIAEYDFVGTLNDSENSDGYYFTEGDTLIEISGDIIVKSYK